MSLVPLFQMVPIQVGHIDFLGGSFDLLETNFVVRIDPVGHRNGRQWRQFRTRWRWPNRRPGI
jgi:hypothetical protein